MYYESLNNEYLNIRWRSYIRHISLTINLTTCPYHTGMLISFPHTRLAGTLKSVCQLKLVSCMSENIGNYIVRNGGTTISLSYRTGMDVHSDEPVALIINSPRLETISGLDGVNLCLLAHSSRLPCQRFIGRSSGICQSPSSSMFR